MKNSKLVININSYGFGEVMINGQKYQHDIIIADNKILPWQRQESHLVVLKDLIGIIKFKPGLIIFGTGAYGAMKISQEAADFCKKQNITVQVFPTSEACQKFNQFDRKQNIAAALHLTC